MTLHLYGLIIGVGIVIAMSVAERISEGRLPVWEAFWYMTLPGLVGARAYHVIDLWEYYQADLGELWAIWNGGLGIWGGIVGALLGLALFAYLRARRQDAKVTEELFILADIFALVAPLAQAIGRIGNLVNQELVGTGALPLFVYEGGLNLLLFALLLVGYKRQVRGSTLGGYLIGYGVIRVVLEPLRVESYTILQLPVASGVGLLSMVIGVLILLRKGKKIWPSSA